MEPSHSPDARERAVSSEPCSIRPNPFNESELSARKRRRTSLSATSTKSGSLPKQVQATDSDQIAAIGRSAAKVDSSEAAMPSTPPESPSPRPEPVSSRVTINLRNGSVRDGRASSPPSPSPIRVQMGGSDGASTLDLAVQEVASVMTSVDGSPQDPVIIPDDDVEEMAGTEALTGLSPRDRRTRLSAALSEFPYFSPPDDTCFDTFQRLHQYLYQGVQDPDEVLQSLVSWLNNVLLWTSAETADVFASACQQNQAFWLNLPELFPLIWRNTTESKHTFSLVLDLMHSYARLTAFTLTVDYYTLNLSNGAADTDASELYAPNFLHRLALVAHKDEQLGNDGREPDTSAILTDFLHQTGGNSGLSGVVQLSEVLAVTLPKNPKRTMEHLAKISALVEALVRNLSQSQQMQGGNACEPTQTLQGHMTAAFRFLTIAWDMMTKASEKFASHLSGDSPSTLLSWLSEIHKTILASAIPEVEETLRTYCANNPEVPHRFLPDAIALERKFKALETLVRSQQMQLRMSAVSVMCNDLIGQWKRYQDKLSAGVDDEAHLTFLRCFAGFLVRHGTIDYFLSPSCHPEITAESANIIGFLMVTKTYAQNQTDLLWRTINTSRDPRIADALVRMLLKIAQLFELDTVSSLFQKMKSLEIDAFNAGMRELFTALVQQVYRNSQDVLLAEPRHICLRLIQEASIFAERSTLSNPEIFTWAYGKMKDIILQACPAPGRQELLSSCQKDIVAKSTTTHGSLQVLFLLTTTGTSLQTLIAEHDFVALIVDELECSISNARKVGFSPVYASAFGPARRKFISSLITLHGSSIPRDLGAKLWDLMVGPGALCPDDVKAGWDDLNNALRRTRLQNKFLLACLEEYLPSLSPEYFCGGTLEFVRELLSMETNNPNTTIFDDQPITSVNSLELLWKIILQATPQTIEDEAIHTLVSEVYVNSAAMKSLPPDRAREVHFSLARRCLRQLETAAKALRQNDEVAVVKGQNPLATVKKHELRFTRSLKVIKDLLRSLSTQTRFSAPDLRSLMLQAPSAVDGDLADLKYQAFDGEEQTTIMPLEIGLHNTGASLLANLKEATGFDNYRLYYRGQLLAPSSDDICKSLRELDIVNGLILVRRQSDTSEKPSRIRPGASALEIEVLRYFKELWEYLSMDETLASEIYHFLIKLPADESILVILEDPETTHRDVFPIGQPFKSLYAVHALREHVQTNRLRNSVVQSSSHDASHLVQSASDHKQALIKVFNLLAAALCDDDFIRQNLSEDLTILLRSHLVDSYVQILKGKSDGIDISPAHSLVSSDLANVLVQILHEATNATQNQASSKLTEQAFDAILASSEKSTDFWDTFCGLPKVGSILQKLVLDDDRKAVRHGISSLIASRSLGARNAIEGADFAAFFWSIVFEMLPAASAEPQKCDEVFNLASQLLTKLAETESPALDLSACLKRCGALLLAHTCTEDITLPNVHDSLAHGLATVLSLALKHARATGLVPPLGHDFSRRLLHHHLFPSVSFMEDSQPIIPQAVVNPNTRATLYDILFDLSRDSTPASLLNDLDGLTPFEEGHESPYFYELPHAFDRHRAVRAPCGYAGLRNLSNTCYLNSLVTQLFMNEEFRHFILSARVSDPQRQRLICETRQLFAALQGSRRRFVDPQSCVGQISTYDETPIDIHNQMDVDEFYNLLFDRWEAQLPFEADKKHLRSIFGGQLVQQVKSKECDHISERFEDFSAIQCDIKGKATLEESLQAYVDGEMMQGDNKYKCSSCDKFVDAVKRACFKTLPNNLIFHLKRFDFNLRTMTRAKINDHFRFPARIDMTPFTVRHLANMPDASEPDHFELVGVLVHSGSAESGHYYSFIRERSNAGSAQKWVEFNDDLVTDWDPSMMEDACFGGQDQRQPFDGGPHEKVYSAYMLFYQRASTINAGASPLVREKETTPSQIPLPPDLIPTIRAENSQIVHRHCLHDPSHIPFVIRVLNKVWNGICSSPNHTLENLAMQVGISHLDQVASRAKDLSDFHDLMGLLQRSCQRCPQCCFAFFEYMMRRSEALVMLLQKNPSPTVRHEISRTLLITLRSLKKNFPEPYGSELLEGEEIDGPNNIITQAVEMFSRLWEQFHVSLRSWPELFGTMFEFARLGKLEAAALIQGNFLHQSLSIITVDAASDLNAQYARLATTLSRRMATRSPSYENIISLIDVLLAAMDEEIEEDRIVEADENRLVIAYEEEKIPFSSMEINLLHQQWDRTRGNVFVDKLIQIGQNLPATNSIIRRLMNLSTIMDDCIFMTLKTAITGQFVHYSVAPYLRAARVYCRFSQNDENIERLRTHINGHCGNVQNAEARSFFEFQRYVYTSAEDFDEQVRTMASFHKWAPGLLGHIDHTVSRDVCHFIQDTLLRYGPAPDFSEDHDGLAKAKAVVAGARRLCLMCLIYLRDNHVERGVPAARDTVYPLLQVISDCESYFSPEDEAKDVADVQYHQLCRAVLGPMTTLTVDEIEDEGSDWENSVGSSEHLNDLDELSMQVSNGAQEGS
ncbi:uncharacterized protein B0I36DRAFT_235736 [Microdochium trichocladiopsis]|uniref:USP domain-containing protein n=1 Tax=Microdochium trichocladiopsis TaxID=1682393 RepID=A0A9P8YG93_9PEZI|nr:uncharacterized protein B0I36DRAFT_235736 [Microdochium trichocladiopsis]KAH7041162.1 hypothetical protein B0I36DRAFT_235736 [Microdochium trichocladiopsis]